MTSTINEIAQNSEKARCITGEAVNQSRSASERVGIRLQARLLMPLYYSGAYFGVGTGGSGFSVGGGIHGVQGDFTGGLVLFLRK